MASVPRNQPEVLDGLPPDPHTPEPATQAGYVVLAAAGEDPFAPAGPPLEFDDVLRILVEDLDDPPDAA
jgi:hypothetical protein